jgi:thiol-disulfide isomerase/thioredoxin
MSEEVLGRLLLALLIIGAGTALYLGANQLLLARARLFKPDSELQNPGKPVLLYFTTPTCAPCKTIQRPAILRLQDRLGEALQVVEVDAAAEPDLAGRWGVMSVPTTFVLDASGQPRYVNHGVTLEDKLAYQVQSVSRGG